MRIDPHDILNQMSRPPGWAGWVPTFLPGGFRPLDPRVEDVRATDLAWGLSHKYRYGGQSNPAVTVAEHVLMTAKIIRTLWPGETLKEKAGLLHDACEAYTHDIQATIRKNVQVVHPDTGEVLSWDEFDTRITHVVYDAFQLDRELLFCPEVRAADILACVIEKQSIWNLNQTGDWGLPKLPKELEGLQMRFWNPVEADAKLRVQMQDLGLWR